MKVVQITDLHLYKEASGKWRDKINTLDSFEKTLRHALKHENPDIIILTGDLSDDGTLESYQHLSRLIEGVGVNTYCIPGNHDVMDVMRQVLPGKYLHLQPSLSLKNWEIIFLNSVVDGAHHGHLAEQELSKLQYSLTQGADKNIAIIVHHNPVLSNSPALDSYGLKNCEQFFEVIRNNKNVQMVLYGHVHQELVSLVHNIICMACPSSCIQFLPKAVEFTVDILPPGYRWIQLHDNGSFDTCVRYL